ncbi:MAG: ATP-binding protein [Bacteroidales bacterium]|nr:ATP-binding protein [Bacteroidales bacterium]
MHPLEKMIAEGEHLHQDFKYFLSDARKIARSVAAFANTDGGRLLIGVKDNGKIVGIKNDEDIHLIEAAAQVFCRPAVDYEPKIWEYGTKRVLEVDIAPSPSAPHTAPTENGGRAVFIRKADENKVASAVESRYLALKYSSEPLNLAIGRPQQRILDYFALNKLPFEPGYPYDTAAIATACLMSERDCIDSICKLILLNETV